jgi:hypothetical protein
MRSLWEYSAVGGTKIINLCKNFNTSLHVEKRFTAERELERTIYRKNSEKPPYPHPYLFHITAS